MDEILGAVSMLAQDQYGNYVVQSTWEKNHISTNFSGKEIVEPVMRMYTEATNGSYIETKESALVWHYYNVYPDSGSWQAKELLDHFENLFANEPFFVKKGKHIIEVKSQRTSCPK
ncbi:probable alpha,alpha-trehalose-phosphate synthase [UDP-forming] 10 isoform X1 [Cajanus cajan]|uniref:probable alpha,alpha-trehalose-phosphate synthase [UDP-forming] 10 isoform X1 n=1 Tax=Cajanus cajan TaxID=3821 RepID=UPI00098D7CD3|nr:probable alpha,alpha-trehalose-phosphate synthase [UDP-forming] 10 isoform X1 [Cajanus cajan]